MAISIAVPTATALGTITDVTSLLSSSSACVTTPCVVMLCSSALLFSATSRSISGWDDSKSSVLVNDVRLSDVVELPAPN